MVALPRLVVAAPASGHGKTTVATGLMAALRARGLEVSGHKVGPDYIDPGYHALATGRPGRNLDPHLVGEDLLAPLLLHGAATPVPADLAVVEGVMGLYDGAMGREGFASTAHVATALGAPVLLVVDISHAARTVAAVVLGMATFDPRVQVAGVLLNKAGSERHAREVTAAVEAAGVPVLGVLGRDDGIVAPSRHLGLVPAQERPEAEATVRRLAAQVAARVDLDRVVEIARSAPPLDVAPWDPARALGDAARGAGPDAPVVAVAGGRAFTFSYAETEELLRAAGCRPVVFDPTADAALPEGTAGIYLGGGFPEVHAAGLAENAPMRASIAAAVAAGVPTVAECAGLLYLCETVDGSPMVGSLPAHAAMTPRLTLGYRRATADRDSVLAPAGYAVTAHEFHRTGVEPPAPAAPGHAAWTVDGVPVGWTADPAGTGSPTLHASYLHVHWAGHPVLAARFAAAVRSVSPVDRGNRNMSSEISADKFQVPSTSAPPHPAQDEPDVDLHHHGDREVAGLVDFAVNVSRARRPEWLDRALRSSLDDLARYPDATDARAALAHRHGRAPEEVLPTAGGAEAFTLLARMRPWQHPVVVHPQFTEPEAALRAAGHDVRRAVCAEADGFRLDPQGVPEHADLVVVGNPTNPTGVLHPAATIAALARPGRLVVVDEAFLDAVPGEPESLAAARLDGVAVVRSLTKTWAVPGVRAGYVLAPAAVVAELAAQQPPWSVSTPAAAAMVACSSPEALAETAARADETARDRAALVAGLAGLGLHVVGTPVTPFVLLQGPPGLREALREEGYAVRRGDTFPGLGPTWVRVAVRPEPDTRALLDATRAALQRLAAVPR